MNKRTTSSSLSSNSVTTWKAMSVWWRQTGEPLTLTGLVLLAFAIPPLVLLEMISLQQGLRGMVALAWIAGSLAILRLPRLLQREPRRMTVLAGVGIAAVGVMAFSGMGSTNEGVLFAGSSATQAARLTFKADPRISRQAFAALLQRGVGGGASPAAPVAEELYDIIAGYGVDPAVALAFFAHESQFCTTGSCANSDTKNWGAMRGAYKAHRVHSIAPGPFVRYKSWQESVRDWCELILYKYVNRGLDTVDAAVPVYAPTSDGNSPTAYIDAIYRMVAVWQGRYPDLPSKWTIHTYPDNLEQALMTETFLSSGVEYHPTWAFHSYMLAEAKAGRPLGIPVDESRRISVGGKKYAIQTFAFDTLYTPLENDESKTNWGDVRRLSNLLKQQAAPAPAPASAAPTPQPAAAPAPQPTLPSVVQQKRP